MSPISEPLPTLAVFRKDDGRGLLFLVCEKMTHIRSCRRGCPALKRIVLPLVPVNVGGTQRRYIGNPGHCGTLDCSVAGAVETHRRRS